MGRYVAFDLIEKLAEPLRAMPLHAFNDNDASLHVEGGNQGGLPVPLVIVHSSLSLSRTYLQKRLRAIEWLNWLFSSTHSTMARSGGER